MIEHRLNLADLRLFGPNATISTIGKICFDFSNHLQKETISTREMRSILDWIGISVDIAILSTFFSQKAFTILAVWEALVSTVRNWKHSAAFEVLSYVHLSIKDRAPWTIATPFRDIAHCVHMAPNHVATMMNAYSWNQQELNAALRNAVRNRGPIELVKQLIRAGAYPTSVDELVRYFASDKCEKVDLPLLEILLEAGTVVDQPSPYDDHDKDWSKPNNPTHSTDYILLNWGHSTNHEGLWSLVSVHSDRQRTTVTVPGILQAAQGGQEQLRSYFNDRSKPLDDQDRKKLLEIALSEASGRGNANVVQSLVQFGVDPNVGMLLSTEKPSSKNIWHPVIRAVNSGQFHTLKILVSEPIADIVFLEDRVDEQLDLCSLRNMERSQRGQILQVLSALDLSTACRNGILLCAIKTHYCQHGHEDPDYGFVNQLLDLGLACLDCPRCLEGETSHILVRAIQKGCDVRALNYLVQRDVEVLSGLSAVTIRALLEATISRSGSKRYATLAFLDQNVKGVRSCVEENYSSLLLHLLEHIHCTHSLKYRRGTKHWECGCEFMITLKWFLDLGARLEASFLAELIKHADDQFMLGMIHSVADVSTIDGCYALESSIRYDRLNLAVALIERGAPVNDNLGRDRLTALQRACQKCAPLWFIRLLVDRGADVNTPPDAEGLTALQAACYFGAQLSCISFLIDKGADINAPPALRDGFTALQFAASKGLMNVAGLLLDHGADVNALSGVVEYLYDYNPGPRFIRALDLAAKYSRLDMAHFLIVAGARSFRPGCTGFKGAIEIASRRNKFAVASLIKEHADSCSEDPMEAERMWLRENPQACMHNGKIQDAKWVAFVKRGFGESGEAVRAFVKEQRDQCGE